MDTPLNPTFALDDKVQAFLTQLEETSAAAIATMAGIVAEPFEDFGISPD